MKLLFLAVALFLGVEATLEKERNLDDRMGIMENRMGKMEGSMAELLEVLKTLTEASGNKRPLQHVVNIVPGAPSDIEKMNDSDLEERVQILEFKVGNLQEDFGDLHTDVEGLEFELTLVETEQLGQDQRLFDLEDDTEVLETGFNELRLADLQIKSELNDLRLNVTQQINDFDAGLNDVQAEITALNSRLDELELDEEQIAFRVTFSADKPLVPIGGVALFDVININIGDGYNSVTGEFVVPPGGAGLYYFNANFLFDFNEFHAMIIRHNGDYSCEALGDGNNSGDYSAAACGAVVSLAEGDVVDVYHERGETNTPCFGESYRSTFTGFRIAPE